MDAKLIDKRSNLFHGSWFLLSELVARKSKDTEALGVKRVVQLDELPVVTRRQASSRRNVHNQADATLVTLELDGLAAKQLRL